MNFHKEIWPRAKENTCPNDEVDALIRWALRNSVAGEGPSPEVWDKIKARLEQPEAQPFPRRRGGLALQLPWLAQLVVLGILILVAFGLSLSQGFEPSLDHEYVVNGELTPQPGSEEVVSPSTTDDDMLSGYYSFRTTRELSGYYSFRTAREMTIFDRRLAP